VENEAARRKKDIVLFVYHNDDSVSIENEEKDKNLFIDIISVNLL